jgi:hypothetical protein
MKSGKRGVELTIDLSVEVVGVHASDGELDGVVGVGVRCER